LSLGDTDVFLVNSTASSSFRFLVESKLVHHNVSFRLQKPGVLTVSRENFPQTSEWRLVEGKIAKKNILISKQQDGSRMARYVFFEHHSITPHRFGYVEFQMKLVVYRLMINFFKPPWIVHESSFITFI